MPAKDSLLSLRSLRNHSRYGSPGLLRALAQWRLSAHRNPTLFSQADGVWMRTARMRGQLSRQRTEPGPRRLLVFFLRLLALDPGVYREGAVQSPTKSLPL